MLSSLQKRFFAWGMAQANTAKGHRLPLQGCPSHGTLDDLKHSLLNQLRGKVLEIGPGAGASFAHLPRHIHWIGVEPNPHMHPYLSQEAKHHGIQVMALYEGVAEHLPLNDSSVDAVISTHVLCSVSDIRQALREIRRVLKPGGRLIFLEHVADQSGSWNRRIQNFLAPLWSTLFDNCHPNRATVHYLKTEGFELIQDETFQLSLPIIGPHRAGIATAPTPAILDTAKGREQKVDR